MSALDVVLLDHTRNVRGFRVHPTPVRHTEPVQPLRRDATVVEQITIHYTKGYGTFDRLEPGRRVLITEEHADAGLAWVIYDGATRPALVETGKLRRDQ